MGHRNLGQLPETRNWKKVINLLSTAGNPAKIALATSEAAKKGLEIAKKDPGVAATVYYLMKFIWASNKESFADESKNLSIKLPPNAGLLDVVVAFNEGLDQRLRKMGHRTDLAEMARQSAADTMMDLCQSETGSLFETTLDDTIASIKKHATPQQFSFIGKRFFGKFMYRFLDYHLSREIPNHIGKNQRFSTIAQANGFKEALQLHCLETVRIIKEFSGCWPSATDFHKGITEHNVRTEFLPVAFMKIRKELQRREGSYAV